MIDLDQLHTRLRSAFPQMLFARLELEHAETRVRHPALVMETQVRKKDHIYRMTITVIDEVATFFVHLHGESDDLTTRNAPSFSKEDADTDAVFAIVHRCWEGPSA